MIRSRWNTDESNIVCRSRLETTHSNGGTDETEVNRCRILPYRAHLARTDSRFDFPQPHEALACFVLLFVAKRSLRCSHGLAGSTNFETRSYVPRQAFSISQKTMYHALQDRLIYGMFF